MKRVLLVSQSQDGSYVNLINDAVKRNAGILSVITGKNQDIADDVTVIEAPKYNSESFVGRFKTWYAFVSFAKKYIKRNIESVDLFLFTSNPPINQSLIDYVCKRGKASIYLVWDIYPDCIEKSFGNKVKPITGFWRNKNRKIYGKCQAVLTIGNVMKQNLLASYPEIDVDVIPYHTDSEFIHPISRDENPFAKQYHLQDKKVFMYSGKMGFGHGFSEILTVAERLKDRNDIAFVFIGFGSGYEDIKDYVENHRLRNALVLPYQPIEMLPYTLGCADVSFITMKKTTDGLFLPSKIYDAMASGSAIIAISGGHNDVAELLSQKEIGIQVDAGDADALQQAVIRLAGDCDLLKMYQLNARDAAVDDYDIEKVTEAYSSLFSRCMS